MRAPAGSAAALAAPRCAACTAAAAAAAAKHIHSGARIASRALPRYTAPAMHMHTRASLFNATASAPKDGAAGGSAAAGPEAAGPSASGEESQSSGAGAGETPKGDGEAGADFQQERAPGGIPRWLNVSLKVGLGAAFFWAVAQGHIADAFNYGVETLFLNQLRTHGPSAIHDVGTWGATFTNPAALANTAAMKSMLYFEPQVLDRLISEGLNIPGIETSLMGVGSEALNLDDMARANWILNLLFTPTASDPMMVVALRRAHLRSVRAQTAFLDNWSKGVDERAAVFKAHLAATEPNLNDSDVSQRITEFRTLSEPEQRLVCRSRIPMTFLDLLVQHGMHHRAKDTPEKFEEELKSKFNAATAAREKARIDQITDPAVRAVELSVDKQKAIEEKNAADLEAVLEAKRPLFQRLITDGVEKSLSMTAWSLVRAMAEPNIEGQGLLLGREHAADIEAIMHSVDRLTKSRDDLLAELSSRKSSSADPELISGLELQVARCEEQISDHEVTASLRENLIRRWLIPMCFVIVPPSGGSPALWGPESSATASEVLGSLLFDIPDLATKFRASPPIVQNALFGALANLSQIYVEGSYPGGAVRAAELVVQCDPNNVQIMATLAAEKLRLGVAQQLAADPAASLDPRTNPHLADAIATLRRALAIDPTHLDASFQLLRVLVTTGEQDEKTLGSAVDRLIKSVRHSPTTTDPSIGILPGAGDSLAPLAETVPQLSPAYNLLIRTLERLGRLDEASELANEWSFRTHTDALAHFTVGRLTLREGDLDSAEHALRTAYDLDPSKPETLYHLALARFKAGDLDGSEEFVVQAIEARAKVERRVREKVNQQLLAGSMSAATNAAPAAPAAAGAAEAPQTPRTPQRYLVANTIPSIHLLRAKILARRDDIPGALAALDEFARDKPLATEGLILRARLLQQTRQTREAYEAFTRLVRVWQRRITAPVTTTSAKGKDAAPTVVVRAATTRKAYFDDRRRSSERAIFDQLVRTCTQPTDKAARDIFQKNVEEIPQFRTLCDEVNKLKAIK